MECIDFLVNSLQDMFTLMKKDKAESRQNLYLGLGNGKYLPIAERGQYLTQDRANQLYAMRINLYVDG